jgi:hypothetical protein
MWPWLDLWLIDDFRFSGREAATPTAAIVYGKARIGSPSRSGQSLATKRFLMYFALKMKAGNDGFE